MDLNGIDLNLLVSFDALISERSVTLAAQRLRLGQPAMSAALARLRKLLGDPVLVRDGRNLAPTPLAESLELPVREVLARIDSLLRGLHTFDPATDERVFTVMASDYATVTYLQPRLVALQHVAPRVRVQVRQITANIDELLRRNRVDLAVVPREVFAEYRNYRHEVLFTDPWVCAVDADHPTVGNHITLEQFCALPYLATGSDGEPTFVEMQFDRAGIERRTELTAALGVAAFLLRGTSLITVIPRRIVDRMGPMAGIRSLEPPMELAPLTETLVWNPSNDDDPGHRWMREFLRTGQA